MQGFIAANMLFSDKDENMLMKSVQASIKQLGGYMDANGIGMFLARTLWVRPGIIWMAGLDFRFGKWRMVLFPNQRGIIYL